MDLDGPFFARHWPLSGVRPGRTVSTYPTRQVLLLHADQGSFAAKIDAAPPPGGEADRRLEVLDHLVQLGFPHAPGLLRTRTGARLVQTGGRTVYLLEQVPDPMSGGGGLADVAAWAELGAVAAKLNAQAGGTDAPILSVRSMAADLGDSVKGLPFEQELPPILERISELENAAPSGLVHGEINFANARRRRDGTVVLLDWDGAGTGPLALESGYPLITQFISEDDLTFARDRAAAFYRGYAGSGRSSDQDRRRLFAAALLQAGLLARFGDPPRRWRRIRHALEHEQELLSVVL